MKKKITKCKYELKFDYYVTDDGRVYSDVSKKFLSPQLDKNGYEKVVMTSTDGKRHRYSVHRLVMENFNPVENMSQLQVNHKDGNKRNNNLDNLEWCTNYENTLHAIRTGLRDNNGEKNPSARLTTQDVLNIVSLFKQNYTCAAIARQYHVHATTIEKIKKRQTWTSVTNSLDF